MTDAILRNASRDADIVHACTMGGVEHDYRPEQHDVAGAVMVCVWCRAVMCGTIDTPGACIEPWHHEPVPHRDAAGVTWPIGGDRPAAP